MKRSSLEGGTAARAQTRPTLKLLGAFELALDGDSVLLSEPAQRLLAFLALRERPVLRTYVADTLWLESTEGHARGSLRSALWRLRRSGHDLVVVTSGRLSLAPEVAVDVRLLVGWAQRALEASGSARVAPPPISALGDALAGELLPDWYDDWLMVERERVRELRARALECVCEQLTAIGSFKPAVEAGLAALDTDPLRESTHRCLISLHLAEGNQAEALRSYGVYRDLLHDRLGLDPSTRMEDLVRGLRRRRVA